MSHLNYYAYPEHGLRLRELLHYSQAVRVGDRIELSGQCGWDPKTGDVPDDQEKELENIFKNVNLALRDAGGKGWEQVFKVRLYATCLDEEMTGIFIKLLREYLPNHTPILTVVKVAGLAGPTLHYEVEVAAHDPQGSNSGQSA